ncbi:unnamed protein product [Nezara viridula]|uniref:Uncharacterized protein n=1 Tax=Nezara viridula TaxID=85310 RepID=A0A9P0HL03_NEZVI|nr:unnamed protein product [Nezara viridula]
MSAYYTSGDIWKDLKAKKEESVGFLRRGGAPDPEGPEHHIHWRRRLLRRSQGELGGGGASLERIRLLKHEGVPPDVANSKKPHV